MSSVFQEHTAGVIEDVARMAFDIATSDLNDAVASQCAHLTGIANPVTVGVLPQSEAFEFWAAQASILVIVQRILEVNLL